jgi:hypothetical protein
MEQGDIWLYKSDASGRNLGTLSAVGPTEIRALLREAAKEYGALYRAE